MCRPLKINARDNCTGTVWPRATLGLNSAAAGPWASHASGAEPAPQGTRSITGDHIK